MIQKRDYWICFSHIQTQMKMSHSNFDILCCVCFGTENQSRNMLTYGTEPGFVKDSGLLGTGDAVNRCCSQQNIILNQTGGDITITLDISNDLIIARA